MLDERLLEIICCPKCKCDLIYDEETKLTCNHCGLKYPLKDGIPVLLVEEARQGKPELSIKNRHKYAVKKTFNACGSTYDEVVHPYFSSRRREEIKKVVGGKILEVGCGPGTITKGLLDKHDVIAVDLSQEMATVVSQKCNITGVVADAETLPFKQAVFDTVVSGEVIYYLNDPTLLLSESFRVLKQNGTAVISVLSQNWIWVDKIRKWLGKLGMRVGYFDDCYDSTFYGSELIQMFKTAGFTNVQMQGIVFFPFAKLDSFNRLLEKSPLHKLAIGLVIWGRKK